MLNILPFVETSTEPSVRYSYNKNYLQLNEKSPEMLQLSQEIKNSPRVQTMLNSRNSQGKFPWHAYQKWSGSFWTFLVLADLGYPLGDEALIPLREQILEWLLDPHRLKAIPFINGRWRRCACQEGGAVYSILKLGLADSRIEQLVHMLLKWQWPDGGWNCDKHSEASHSSFHETCIPLRALNAYWLASGDQKVKPARDRAAERLLSRSLFKNPATGVAIAPVFTKLAYPSYWHYDILYGLRVMAECGLINDPRCKDALHLLETKQLPDGGFRAEAKYYQYSQKIQTGHSLVDWGSTGKQKFNPFITVEGLGVLRAASRI
ncbi:MAG: hypothetical protein CVU42_07275 [Chloroflexi bacterium HGW-Chloroflexi-4]|jgi:hypothetical protein|nr:MAG: hypothetical protein CVU42_07275 [Chloroflexi bacterium HGW-Chloroflexi-4]